MCPEVSVGLSKAFRMPLSRISKSIWQAGIDAVKSDQLLQQVVQCASGQMCIAGTQLDLKQIQHIEVLGCGKAGRGMAIGMVHALANLSSEITVSGFINVPADCAEPLADDFESPSFRDTRCHEIANSITLHVARPAGINEPTEAGIAGTSEIIQRLQNQSESGLTIFLVSGGGSALLEAPRSGISLDDLLLVTRHLARSGATIEELNTVRTQMSQVKGGGLLRHARHGRLISLIVSDIIADPLPLIASGPCVPASSSVQDAVAVLQKYAAVPDAIPDSVWQLLEQERRLQDISISYSNHLIGTNAVACEAAAAEAKKQGFEVILLGSENCGEAADLGRSLAKKLRQLRDQGRPSAGSGYCVIAGGETTVTMSSNVKLGKGGRNQEVVLAALHAHPKAEDWQRICLLSGGTDGEDGPTDAAGAFVDETVALAASQQNLPLSQFLSNHDSYPLFQMIDGLLQTGPTHTNVMDLAVGIVCFD